MIPYVTYSRFFFEGPVTFTLDSRKFQYVNSANNSGDITGSPMTTES